MQKKICLVGSFAVGKTSLIARFVKSIFLEKYHTTVGVKVDKKVLTVNGAEVTLMIWDLAGDDRFGKAQLDYLRGSSGCLLVADGTRRSTLDAAVSLRDRIIEIVGEIPFLLLLNKVDLHAEWEITETDLTPLIAGGWRILRTSARTGECVEDAFHQLAASMLGPQ